MKKLVKELRFSRQALCVSAYHKLHALCGLCCFVVHQRQSVFMGGFVTNLRQLSAFTGNYFEMIKDLEILQETE